MFKKTLSLILSVLMSCSLFSISVAIPNFENAKIRSISQNILEIDADGEKNIIEIIEDENGRTVHLQDQNRNVLGSFIFDSETNSIYSTITGKTVYLDLESKGITSFLDLSDTIHKISYSQIADLVGTTITIASVAAALVSFFTFSYAYDLLGDIATILSNSWTIISDGIKRKTTGGIQIVIGKEERRIYKQGKWHTIAYPYVKNLSLYK